GSAGIYNITHYDDSMKLLERKMNNIMKTDSKIVLAANPGCILQLKYGAKKFHVDVEIMHPVSFIKKSLNANK
ncbi:MAG: heterodisulfide reductase-related iron-sulfur binding cluster, partial [Ignavibacteriaceae bacterium]